MALACSATSTAGRTEDASRPAFLLDPRNEPTFRALQAAVAEGEDELAGRILLTLERRNLTAPERELVAGTRRVLTGRELVRSLELTLEVEPSGEGEGRYRLFLVARSEASQEICLRMPPSDLKRLRASMDARGVEGMAFESRSSWVLDGLVLTPTVSRRIEVLSYELPLGRALAVRQRWRLETRSGEIEVAGERFPAAQVKIKGCEHERLSPLLPPEPVPAGALAEDLSSSDPPGMRALLELALRTPDEKREEALRVLAPVVRRLAHSTPERIVAAEPALRWLTQNRDIGPDPAAWSRYLEVRSQSAQREESAPVDGLDLPARPRSDRERQG